MFSTPHEPINSALIADLDPISPVASGYQILESEEAIKFAFTYQVGDVEKSLVIPVSLHLDNIIPGADVGSNAAIHEGVGHYVFKKLQSFWDLLKNSFSYLFGDNIFLQPFENVFQLARHFVLRDVNRQLNSAQNLLDRGDPIDAMYASLILNTLDEGLLGLLLHYIFRGQTLGRYYYLRGRHALNIGSPECLDYFHQALQYMQDADDKFRVLREAFGARQLYLQNQWVLSDDDERMFTNFPAGSGDLQCIYTCNFAQLNSCIQYLKEQNLRVAIDTFQTVNLDQFECWLYPKLAILQLQVASVLALIEDFYHADYNAGNVKKNIAYAYVKICDARELMNTYYPEQRDAIAAVEQQFRDLMNAGNIFLKKKAIVLINTPPMLRFRQLLPAPEPTVSSPSTVEEEKSDSPYCSPSLSGI